MPKVSIIIPVYNAEAFIDTTIQSLRVQTLEDCEFIFVNDGSKDNSSAIIEQYTKVDGRIKLINQNNQGISIARNNGINIATGDYITFMDNDDYVKPDMYKTLYDAAKTLTLDIVVSKTLLGRDDKYILKEAVFPEGIIYDNSFIQDNIIPSLLKEEDMFAVWNKLYNRDFIERHFVRFPSNREIEEDSMFNFAAFNKAQRVQFIDYSGYYYRNVSVNESRKFIERDYFARAAERYQFDYKTFFDLPIASKEAGRLKAIRFIHRVFYLIFSCALQKGTAANVRYAYIKNMMLSTNVQYVISHYSAPELEVEGRFQKLVFSILRKKSGAGLSILVKAIQFFYSPKLSEILRKLNKTGTGGVVYHDA